MVYTNEMVSHLYIEYLRASDALLFHQVMIEAGRAEILGSQEALEPARRKREEAYQKYSEAEESLFLAEMTQMFNNRNGAINGGNR